MTMLRKTLLAIGFFAAFATLTATASAQPPSKADKRAAKQECKAERQADRAAFKEQHGSFGKCVSAATRQNKAERKAARSNAAQDCRAEREEMGTDAFREAYGSNGNTRNAFGKCVSSKVKEELEDEEEQEAPAAA